MKKVMVFGTFDLVHPGHRNFFEQARKHGEYLIAVIARDATVEKVKGRPPMFKEDERVKHVEATGLVDMVRLGSTGDKHAVIREERPEVIALGYDQDKFIDGLAEAVDYPLTIVRLEAFKPEVFKSTLIKQQLLNK